MKIALEISAKQIADLFTSAIEGGDPVTTASRGGWCNGINCPAAGDAWDYSDPAGYGKAFVIKIIEVDDETTGHETTHTIRSKHVRNGLAIMAQKFPQEFAQIMTDNIDAPCADAFLQSIVFGEEKYA